jgi:hypothetical protein
VSRQSYDRRLSDGKDGKQFSLPIQSNNDRCGLVNLPLIVLDASRLKETTKIVQFDNLPKQTNRFYLRMMIELALVLLLAVLPSSCVGVVAMSPAALTFAEESSFRARKETEIENTATTTTTTTTTNESQCFISIVSECLPPPASVRPRTRNVAATRGATILLNDANNIVIVFYFWFVFTNRRCSIALTVFEVSAVTADRHKIPVNKQKTTKIKNKNKNKINQQKGK